MWSACIVFLFRSFQAWTPAIAAFTSVFASAFACTAIQCTLASNSIPNGVSNAFDQLRDPCDAGTRSGMFPQDLFRFMGRPFEQLDRRIGFVLTLPEPLDEMPFDLVQDMP